MNTGINENNLRELAYRIWEAEGCPPDQAERHWQMAMDKARAEQENFTTGESFLGDTLAAENMLQDKDQHGAQNNTFQAEITEPPLESGGSHEPLKNSKKKSAKIKTSDTFANQDMADTSQIPKGDSRSKSGKRKPSENFLV